MRRHEFHISGVEHLATAFGVKKTGVKCRISKDFEFHPILVMSAPVWRAEVSMSERV